MLNRIPWRNHITPVLRELHWLKIHDQIIIFILLLTHKVVNNTAPEYLIRRNVKSTTIRTRASFDPCLLCVPPISKRCADSFFDRFFVYADPTLWNALDLDIRLLPFDTFNPRVKTNLYLKYFVNWFLLFLYYLVIFLFRDDDRMLMLLTFKFACLEVFHVNFIPRITFISQSRSLLNYFHFSVTFMVCEQFSRPLTNHLMCTRVVFINKTSKFQGNDENASDQNKQHLKIKRPPSHC